MLSPRRADGERSPSLSGRVRLENGLQLGSDSRESRTMPRSTGVRGSQRQGQARVLQLGADHFDPIVNEAHAVLHARGNDALEARKGIGAPVGAMRAAVIAGGGQAANVA